jgi:hypothetical protein
MVKVVRLFYKLTRTIYEKDEEEITTPPYIVGSDQLLVFYDGLLCIKGGENQYTEIGQEGEESTKIKFHFTCKPEEEITFIVLK